MTQVTITVDDSHLRSIGSVARELAAHGMRVDKVMAAAGFITGSISSPAVKSALRAIPGVAAIDPGTSYRISPPDSDVQ